MIIILKKIIKLLKRILNKSGYSIIKLTPRKDWPELISRYDYQKFYNDFKIYPNEVVLDIGCGGYPFHYANILTDRYIKPTHHRSDMLLTNGKPFLLSSIEKLPFSNKSIDFIYCSHILEHVDDPIEACSEIVRVGKRGYIETPTLGKDMLFSWAKGMHKWHIVSIADNLVFFEYSARQADGIRSSSWSEAIFSHFNNPIQEIYYSNPDLFNIMFNWQGHFKCVIYYLNGKVMQKNL